MSVSTYVPSSYTIPPWPGSCVNAENVYRNCGVLTRVWETTATPEELMPETITRHSNAVLRTGASLAELFDVDWGGTSNIFFDVSFYTASGTLFPDTATWHNVQRVRNGSDGVPPNTDTPEYDQQYPEDLWTYGWNNVTQIPYPYQNITKDTNVTRTYSRKTHTINYFDLYDSTTVPVRTEIVDRKTAAKKVPTIHYRPHVVPIGWTTGAGSTPETSGTPIHGLEVDGIYGMFDYVSSDINAYWHYYIDTTMNVSYRFYNGDTLSSTSETVEYGRYPTNVPTNIDSRTGHSFKGWYDGDVSVQNVLTYQIIKNTELSAHYDKIKYPVTFIGGYDHKTIAVRNVPYQETLTDLPGYGTKYNHIAYYGWDDDNKYKNVTSSQTVTSLFRSGSITGAHIKTYEDYGLIRGNISSGTVTSVSVTIPEGRSYTVSNISMIGSAFSFHLNKNTDANLSDSLVATVKDEKNLSYKLTFNFTANKNYMVAYLNNLSWGRNMYRRSVGEEEYSYNVDARGQYSPLQQNPDSSKYLGVMESCSCWHVDDGWSKMRIKFGGYDKVSFYLRTCGESYADYVLISDLNVDFTEKPDFTTVGVKHAAVDSTLEEESDIEFYDKVTYDNLDLNEEYFVTVVYRKDSGLYSNTDRGYLLFDCPENTSEQTNVEIRNDVI